MPEIVFDALFPDVRPPARGTAGSAGYDLSAYLRGRRVRVWHAGAMEERDAAGPEFGTLVLAPGEKALVPLGFRARLPDGHEAQIRPRSGLSVKTDLVIANAPGTVDADYPDEWCVQVKNGGSAPLVVNHGERIALMVVARFVVMEFVAGTVIRTSERTSGFGSTGTNATGA